MPNNNNNNNNNKKRGNNSFANRQARLLQRLLRRHRRLPDEDNLEGSRQVLYANCSGEEEVSPSRQPMNPVKKAVSNRLRRKHRERFKPAPSSNGSLSSSDSSSAPGIIMVPLKKKKKKKKKASSAVSSSVSSPLPPPPTPPPAASTSSLSPANRTTNTDASTESHSGPVVLSYNNNKYKPLRRDPPLFEIVTPARRRPSSFMFASVRRDGANSIEYHNVIESMIGKQLTLDDDEDECTNVERGLRQSLSKEPIGVPVFQRRLTYVSGGIWVTCLCSLVLLPTMVLLWVECALIVLMTNWMIRQDGIFKTLPELRANKARLEAVKEAWATANSHLRSRLMADRAQAHRMQKLEHQLSHWIQESRSCHMSPQEVVAMDQLRRDYVDAVKKKVRKKILVVLTKSMLVTNRRQEYALNNIGVELLLARLRKIEGVSVDKRNLSKLLEHNGSSSTKALMALYRSAMDIDDTSIFSFDPIDKPNNVAAKDDTRSRSSPRFFFGRSKRKSANRQ